MSSPFQIASASTAAQFEAFKNLLQEYAEHDLDDACNSSIWTDMAQLPGRYAQPSGLVLLAYQDHELAGCGAFVATSTQGMAEIKRVYVRPNFRRQGLALRLTQALIDQAQQNTYQTAAICTWPHNTQALALYQHMGFSPIPCFREATKAHLTFMGLQLQLPPTL
jgi:ribosomal protein S18 acetylase RimI-like enzyme